MDEGDLVDEVDAVDVVPARPVRLVHEVHAVHLCPPAGILPHHVPGPGVEMTAICE